MNKSRYIKKCRLCSSKKLHEVINFGKVPLGNNLSKSKLQSNKSSNYQLKLVQCEKCKHFQLNYEVSPKELYATNYTYLSGVGISFVSHFKNYQAWIEKKCNLKKNCLVLDVGSNDGTCLKFFKNKGFKVLGVDPALLPSKLANKNGIKTINAFFNDDCTNAIMKKYGQVDFITSHNVLAHIGDIQNVFKNIFFLLKDNGYFCFEIGYFLSVLKNNLFDTIYHEHLDYYHASPLVKNLNSIGFSVVNLSTNLTQGGTLRILCVKNKNSKIYYQPKIFLKKEKQSIINNKKFLQSWPTKINKNIDSFSNIIKDEISNNKIVYGYGAPTKATLIIKMAHLRKMSIKNIIEDNPLKVNKYLPKTDIKIIKFDKITLNEPDVIIIFAWNFFSDIIKKIKKVRSKPLKIIIPLPKVKIIEL